MKTCPSCRQVLPDDAQFCPIDGTSLASAESDPLLGTVIADRFVLLERVGQGSSGTIYRAEHVVLRQKLAVKLIHQHLSEDESAMDRFRQEASTLAILKSEHIVKFSDFGVAPDNRVFLAMEFLEGETLATKLGSDGKFKEDRAVALLEQIGDALAEAHALGYVHRDIRPRNIFLTDKKGDEHIKLLDFGLAKLVEPRKGTKTVMGTSIGDPRYMSPEQARGDALDQRSDIYSLSILAYEMVTGSPPFVGAGTFDVLTKHLEAQPVPIGDRVDSVSSHFTDAVGVALSKKAKDRYPTVTRFLNALTGRAPVKVAKERPTLPPKEKKAEAEAVAAGWDAAGEAVLAQQAAEAPAEQAVEAEAAKQAAEAEAAKQAAEAEAAQKAAEAEAAQKAAEAEAAKQAEAEAAQKAAEAEAAQKAAEAEAAQKAAEQQAAEEAAAKKAAEEAAAQKAAEEASVHDTILDTGDDEPPPIPEDSDDEDDEVSDRKTAPETPAAMASEAPEEAPEEPQVRKTEQLSDDEPRPMDPSESGIWFAEGLEAEKQLARKKSGPLPAIYEDLEDEENQKGIPPWVYIIGVAGVAAIALFTLLMVYGGDKDKDKKKPKAVAENHTPTNSGPDHPDDESIFVGGDEPKKDEPKPDEKTDPEPKKPEPKAPEAKKPEAKPDPVPVPPPVPVPVPAPVAKPEPKKVAPKPRKVPRKRVWARPAPKPRRSKPPKKKVDPKASALHVKQGKTALRSGQYDKANAEFAKALQFNPRNAGAHAGLGESAFERGKFGSAEKHLRKAIRLRPRSQRYLVSLGYACFKQAKYKKAVDQFKKALKVNPGNAEAKSGLNAAVRRLGGTGG